MTNTQQLVGKNGETLKLPKLSYLPPEKKQFVIEVTWYTRPEHWSAEIASVVPAELLAQSTPPYTLSSMRESRYCESYEEAENFVTFCKRITVLKKPGVIVRMNYEIFNLALTDTGHYEHQPTPETSGHLARIQD